MNITSAQYKVDVDGTTKTGIKVTIDGVDYVVPIDTRNRHYQAILDWVAKGNTIQEA